MRHSKYLWLLLLAFSIWPLAPTQAAPMKTVPMPPKAAASIDTPRAARLWNLQDADILSIINEVAAETGKNFVVDPRVAGKISLVSSKPINPDQVYDLFLSILELLGYSAIPSGDVVKIIPNMQSGEMATRIASRGTPGKGDEVIVRVIPLENVSATQIIPVIRPLLPQWSNVSSYLPGNVLIVLGRAANINRIDEIIRNIDQASNNDIEIIKLQHASAAQLSTVLTNLQNTAKSNGDMPQVSLAPDERSNSILVSGSKAARSHVRTLIRELDAPGNGVQGNTEVVYLRYLKAKDFAQVLGKIAQNILGKETDTSSPTASSPLTPSAGPMGIFGSIPPRPSSGPSGKTTPDNKTNIQAEPDTNALIITAPSALMSALNNVIAKLDIRPAQVLVEAIIVELDQNDTKNMGIQWGALTSSSAASSTTGSTTTSTAGGAGFQQFGEGIVGIIPHMQIQAVLSMLQTTTGANILSTPSIVVLDNRKATLSVGQQVAEQTGQYSTTGLSSTVTPFNTVGRLDVQLRLDVTPQINLGSAVRLGIKLKNDSLQNPDNPTLNPATNTSLIQNSVLVNSADVLVIGGLISNNITSSMDKIPLLGDLPGIGILFQHKTRRLEKKNLMVFIKPTILYNNDDASAITNTKYTLVRHSQMDWPEDLTHEGMQKLQNTLPPFGETRSLPRPFENET